MGEVYSVLRAIEGWLQGDEENRKTAERRGCPATRSDREVERSCGSFLADEPVLRDLLSGVSTEHDLVEVACTVNRLVFFYVIVRWINVQLWPLVAGGGP